MPTYRPGDRLIFKDTRGKRAKLIVENVRPGNAFVSEMVEGEVYEPEPGAFYRPGELAKVPVGDVIGYA